jgi:hypothetical protein
MASMPVSFLGRLVTPKKPQAIFLGKINYSSQIRQSRSTRSVVNLLALLNGKRRSERKMDNEIDKTL